MNILLAICLAATAWRSEPETIEVRRDTNTPVRLPDVTAAGRGYVVVPVREGLLVPADPKRNFTHRFGTYDYEGCHMRMIGLVENGHAALVTWDDLYANVELRNGPDALATSLSAKSFRIQFLGKGDYVTIGQAYRKMARKVRANPKLAGASNVKLWSTLDRRMNEESTKEESVKVNWTFDEAAQVAEHLKNDLKIEKAIFMIGGWIKRGYDNQHPDILPAAPECGGDAALADCARRVQKLGYTFCLHDNYQDIYRDSPSWNEDYIQKHNDGSLTKGGKWAGGRAYITCAQKAFELAKRPQNLPAVKKLTNADAYFIDTTYAAGLQECFDAKHPLTRAGDMKWKRMLSNYARDVFGMFGSECGREWAIPHADFFEGLTGVSGREYHDAGLLPKLGGTVVPLFEVVYRDNIAMYGKYGYDFNKAAPYVLQHILLGRTLHYHGMPPHLYWKDGSDQTLPPRPAVDTAAFCRGDNGWTAGLHHTDRFIKNTHEILSPLHELTAETPPTRHEFLTPDRKVQRITWGNVEALVNLGATPYQDLPPFGFIIQSPMFIAFHAASFNGLRYDNPPLFTLRALDDRPLDRSRRIRVFHAFGDARVKLGDTIHTVAKEAEISVR